jgi:hypothetical protein
VKPLSAILVGILSVTVYVLPMSAASPGSPASASTASASAAASNDASIISAIQAALPNAKISARTQGKEELISTYRPLSENVQDCKIDAIQIAKALMVDKDFGLTRVRVQFHELVNNADFYQEVVVSLAAIKGFSSGAVTKQEFLDSLDVQKLPERAAATSSINKPADKGTATTSSTNSAIGKPGVSSGAAKQSKEQRFTSRRTGISFKVPDGWTVVENATGDTVLKMSSSQSNMVGIELHFDGNLGTPEKRAMDVRSTFNYQGVTFERFLTRASFGTASYPGSVVLLTYPNWDNGGTHYYDMHLFFGQYSLYGWCPVSAYYIAGPAFDEIMRSMSFPAVRKGK